MKNQTIVGAIAALSMSLSGVAFGQNDKDVRADEANRREHLPLRQQQQLDRQDRARAQPERREGRNESRNDRRDDRRDDRRAPPREWDHGPGAGPDHNFYRGGRLPPEYRQRMYVVDDWRGHRLQRPPSGYQWVQTGPDYVLVAITTGIIASILLNY